MTSVLFQEWASSHHSAFALAVCALLWNILPQTSPQLTPFKSPLACHLPHEATHRPYVSHSCPGSVFPAVRTPCAGPPSMQTDCQPPGTLRVACGRQRALCMKAQTALSSEKGHLSSKDTQHREAEGDPSLGWSDIPLEVFTEPRMSPQCPQEPESQDSMSLASSGSPLLFSCLPASSDGELTTWGCRPGESAPLWAPAQMEGKLSFDGHCLGLLIWGRASLETGARGDLACLSSPSLHRCPCLPCSLEASCNCMR